MRKPTDEMDISDFEFDQYLEGDSSLSQAYKKAAMAIEPSVNVEKIIFNELDASSDSPVQIPQLVTPGTTARVKKPRLGYRFGWLGPLMGATCVAVLAVGLGLRANLFESDQVFETLANKDPSESIQPGGSMQTASVDTDQTLVNTAVGPDDEQLVAQVAIADTEQPMLRSRVQDSPAVSTEQTVAEPSPPVTDNNDAATTGSVVAADETVISQSMAVSDSSQPELINTQPEARASAQPMVMAPADAMLEADGPRTPPVLDSDRLLEGDQEGTSGNNLSEAIAAGVEKTRETFDQRQSSDDANSTSDSTDTSAEPVIAAAVVTTGESLDELDEQQLAEALEQTEKHAETLESRNSELRDRLAALEQQVLNATQLATSDSTESALAEQSAPVDLPPLVTDQAVTDQAMTEEAKADLRLALNSTPSQSEQGRQLALLNGDEIRQLLTTVDGRESYRNALLSVIGEAGRSGQAQRQQTLLDVYTQFYPDAPQPTAELLQ